MKTDELVISEDYRYYVTREGELAVLMCDLTKVPVDVPFDELDRDSLVFLHEHLDLIERSDREFPLPIFHHYKNGMWASVRPDPKDIVGCLYFAGGYEEAKLELQANLFRRFVCCDESDVVGAVYNPKTGMAHSHGGYVSISGEPSHSLARSIAESIACGDGKWMEATVQSLEQRREAVQRRIDERQEFPQYWSAVSNTIAFFRRDSPSLVVAVLKNGSESVDRSPWNEYDTKSRTPLTKEQAEALLDKPVKIQDVGPVLPPSRQQLFEMVANLRDQMDILNRKVDHWMGQKE